MLRRWKMSQFQAKVSQGIDDQKEYKALHKLMDTDWFEKAEAGDVK